MTREISLHHLKHGLINEEYPLTKADKQAIYAVLEQEPCEDCISRTDAIVTIKNLYPDMPVMDIRGARRKWQEKYSQYIECEKEIGRLPSVQPKTGHWYIDERPESNRETICSNCEKPIFAYHKLDFDYRPKYCPNCGARMSEVSE